MVNTIAKCTAEDPRCFVLIIVCTIPKKALWDFKRVWISVHRSLTEPSKASVRWFIVWNILTNGVLLPGCPETRDSLSSMMTSADTSLRYVLSLTSLLPSPHTLALWQFWYSYWIMTHWSLGEQGPRVDPKGSQWRKKKHLPFHQLGMFHPTLPALPLQNHQHHIHYFQLQESLSLS